jgi:hypothetical protein
MLHVFLSKGVGVHLVIQHTNYVQSIVAKNIIICVESITKVLYWRQRLNQTVNGWRIVVVYILAINDHCVTKLVAKLSLRCAKALDNFEIMRYFGISKVLKHLLQQMI